MSSLQALAGAIERCESITVLTGAGISTASGIPDFRGPQGLWTKDPKAASMSSLPHYMNDPQLRVRAWRSRLEHPAWSAEPNEAHRALVDLEGLGKRYTLITQNIDGLHQAAGSSPDVVIEIHGTLREVVCMACGDRAPMQRALDRVRAGEEDPPCHTCGGILKSATVSFGQNLIAADLQRAQEAARRCDVFLAIGTSLTVFPVAYLPQVAVSSGARLAILNAEPTPYDDIATWVINDPLTTALPALVASL